MKKSFVLYEDQQELFHLLSDEQAGKLIKTIFKYVSMGETPADDILLKIAFEPIKQQINRDSEKYNSIVQKRKEAVAKRIAKNKESKKEIEENSEKEELQNQQLNPCAESLEFKEDVKPLWDKNESSLLDPYAGKYPRFFQQKYVEIMSKPWVCDTKGLIKLSNCLKKIIDAEGIEKLESRICDIITILSKLKFENMKPCLPWLLTNDNFIKIYSGQFDLSLENEQSVEQKNEDTLQEYAAIVKSKLSSKNN